MVRNLRSSLSEISTNKQKERSVAPRLKGRGATLIIEESEKIEIYKIWADKQSAYLFRIHAAGIR